MSVWEAGRVWRDAPHKGAARLVLLSAAFESDDEGVCYVKLKTLARDARVSIRAVQRILPHLAKSGCLTCTTKASGEHIASRYQLGVTYLHPSAHKGVTSVRDRGDNLARPLFRVNKPMGKPKGAPSALVSQSAPANPQTQTTAAATGTPCKWCEDTGIFEAQDGRLRGFCSCPEGQKLQAAAGTSPIERVLVTGARRGRG